MQKAVVGVVWAGVIGAIALGARRELLPRRGDVGAPARAESPARAWSHRLAPVPARMPARAPAPPAAALAAADGSGGSSSGAPATSTATATPGTAAAVPAPAGAEARQSADALLQRAVTAYRRVRSLSAGFVQVTRNPLLGGSTTSRGTLYQRRPDRFLMRFTQPAGDVLVSDGRYFWVYYPSVDAKQVMRAPAGARGQSVDLQAQFLGDGGKRFTPHLEGREPVAGRQAYVLRLVPRGDEAFKELEVWLDPTDYLARRFEITEQNGSVRRLDLSNLRINVNLPDTLFRFTPPAGAHVVERS